MGFSGVNNMAMAGVMSQMAGHSHAHGAAGHSHDHGAAGHSHSHGPGHSHSHGPGGHSHSHGPSHSHPNPLLNNSKSQGNGTMAPPSAPGLTITAVPKTQVANKAPEGVTAAMKRTFDQSQNGAENTDNIKKAKVNE